MNCNTIGSSFYSKSLYLTIFMTFLSGFVTCEAQSILGKWQRDFSKMFTKDKTTGKQVPLSAEQQKQFDDAVIARGYVEVIDFKSNTYTITITAGGKQTVHTEHYTLSGKVLDMNIPIVGGEKTITTIESLSATHMTWDLVSANKLIGVVGYKKISG